MREISSSCAEGKHLACGGSRYHPYACECLCHDIVDAIMIDHHIHENDARVIAARVMKALEGRVIE